MEAVTLSSALSVKLLDFETALSFFTCPAGGIAETGF